MHLLFDTTVLVDVDRKREPTLRLLEHVSSGDHAMLASTVTVAEVFAGANLREDVQAAAERARRVLGQFEWVPLDGAVAERTGELLAYLTVEGEPVGFQDVAVAATHLVADADRLVTGNTDHFERLPPVADDVRTPGTLAEELDLDALDDG